MGQNREDCSQVFIRKNSTSMLMWMGTILQDRRMVITKSDVELTNVSKMRKKGNHCLLPTADGFDLILAWSHQWDGGISPCSFLQI